MACKEPFPIVVILNIPSKFNTGDLRRFFTDYVETDRFSHFQYKRRPLGHLKRQASSQDGSPTIMKAVWEAIKGTEAQDGTNLGFATLENHSDNMADFVGKYDNRHWMGLDEKEIDIRCRIVGMEVEDRESVKVLKEFALLSSQGGTSSSLCPKGNVGTPSKVLKQAISQCRMPSKMIAKLGIGAGASDHGLRYSKVKAPPVLDWSDNPKGRVITTTHTELPKVRTAPTNPGKKTSTGGAASSGIDVTSGVERFDYGDEDTGEEWERHESLHDDTVSARRQLARNGDDWAHDLDIQPGTKERLFEEEMEVVWDKGSSGLVFYTDAQYWHAQKTFEERCTDDWDVDTSVYYGESSAGDRDARDMKSMLPGHGQDSEPSVFIKRRAKPEGSRGKKRYPRETQDSSPPPQASTSSERKTEKVTKMEFYSSFRKPSAPPVVGSTSSKTVVSSPEQPDNHKNTHNNMYKNFRKPETPSASPTMSTAKEWNQHFAQKKKPKSGQSTKFSGNAFSQKMMARQGWKSGQGLGADSSGITDPVDTRGQMTRAGLGYNEVDEGVPPPWASKPSKIV